MCRFKDLIVEITNNPSDIEMCFGTILFNDLINRQDDIDNSKILGKISIAEEKSIYNNYYLKIVAQLFIQTKWYDLFHLDIMETMDLEYSQYIYLKKLIEEYERKYKIANKDSLSELEKKQQELLKKYDN